MTPITETIVVTAIVATSFLLTAVLYLAFLARAGRPLQLSFKGHGVDLKVGQTTLCDSLVTQRNNGTTKGDSNEDV